MIGKANTIAPLANCTATQITTVGMLAQSGQTAAAGVFIKTSRGRTTQTTAASNQTMTRPVMSHPVAAAIQPFT